MGGKEGRRRGFFAATTVSLRPPGRAAAAHLQVPHMEPWSWSWLPKSGHGRPPGPERHMRVPRCTAAHPITHPITHHPWGPWLRCGEREREGEGGPMGWDRYGQRGNNKRDLRGILRPLFSSSSLTNHSPRKIGTPQSSMQLRPTIRCEPSLRARF